jgi:hypothetical protein
VANGDELKRLDMRCNLIRKSIEGALEGKDKSRVPIELSDSILRLQEYAWLMLHHFVRILWFDSGLENVCDHLREYERNSLSSRLVAVISNESDSKMIEGINENITGLLELFWVSYFLASKAP